MRQKRKTDAPREDPRVRRTRKLLQDALVELMADRSFESITTNEITRAAQVNHATFYRHYKDKYHLAEAIFTEAIDSMLTAVGSPERILEEIEPGSLDFQKTWVALSKHVEKNDRLYKTLLSSGGNASFVRRIREYIALTAKKTTEARIRLHQSIAGIRGVTRLPNSDIPFIVLANLFIGNMAWWLEDGRQYSFDQVIEWTRRLLRNGMGGLLRE